MPVAPQPNVLSTDRILNIVFGLLLTGFSWFLVTVWNDDQATQAKMSALSLNIAEQYVRRDDLAEVRASLLRIEEKLDGKADKAR